MFLRFASFLLTISLNASFLIGRNLPKLSKLKYNIIDLQINSNFIFSFIPLFYSRKHLKNN